MNFTLLKIFNAAILSLLFLGASFCFAENVAIYSGSFDPPTLGHKNTALELSEKLEIDKLYIVVKTSGEKNFKASVRERKKMLEEMFNSFQSDDLSIKVIEEWYQDKRGQTSSLLLEHPQGIHMFFGEDVYVINYELLRELEGLRFVVGFRGGNQGDPETTRRADWIRSNTVAFELENELGISSTFTRNLLSSGKKTSGVLYSKVREIIDDHGLYKLPDNSLLKRLKQIKHWKIWIDEVQKTFPDLELPKDAPTFEPLQSLDGEKDAAIKAIIGLNSVMGLPANQLANKLRKIDYGDQSPCSRIFQKAL